ncbi:MAG: hypothetical protein JNN04_01195 [Cyclobacteriaceae bacterium]|nr:hypothetical protein [Cyclobacteriaceae bacterium]
MALKLFVSVLVCLLLLGPGKVQSQDGVLQLQGGHDHYSLGSTLTYFEDTSAGIQSSAILAGEYDTAFAFSTREVLNFGVTNSVIWVKFTLKNRDPENQPQWILLQKNALVDYIALFTKVDGTWNRIETGDRFPFDQRAIKNHEFGFILDLPDTTSRTYYMRFQTLGSMQMPLEVRTPGNFQGFSQQSEMLYGLFSGALIIMFIYNLFVFFSLRDLSYLAYCLFIITNLALHTAYSGHHFQYLLPNSPYLANLSIPLIMAFVPFTVSLFSLSFLSPAKIVPVIRWTLYGVCVISVVLVASSFFLPLQLSTSAAGMLIIASLIAAIVAGGSSWMQGNKGARFYVIAWILLIASGLMTSFRNFGLLENNFLTVHGARMATLLEVTLLSFSLADRYNQFRKEKELAQRELIDMQREANIVLERKVEERTRQLNETNVKLNDTLDKVEVERAKSDSLLLNVLPKEIMKELKDTGKIAPRNYPLATVLFTDIKNFTTFAEKLQPEEVIKSLNECFLAFDDICRKHGLEKIKTLGDGYMAVGGVPVPNSTNPVDAVRAGLEMQKWVSRRNEQLRVGQEERWEIRIGINSGPVVAGIIGKHKFVYDIWGDAVNLASRMESHGEVGKVNISQNTYEHIKDYFVCEHRGRVMAKNKGAVELYCVVEEIGVTRG